MSVPESLSNQWCHHPMNSQEPIFVYTDGGSVGNPGPGGYGVVMRDGDQVQELSRGYRLTTNNRMELMGVLAGLELAAQRGDDRSTVVVSDSRYVVDAVEKGWLDRWATQGWKTKKGRVKNVDMWERIRTSVDGRDVEFRWVKGHSGHPENERCDELVGQASSAPLYELEIDAGYESESGSTSLGENTLFGKADNDAPTSSSSPEPELSHLDASGRASMVSVTEKLPTVRRAVARCKVLMSEQTLDAITSGKVAKGDVLSVARTAGIMAAKRTWELIPMCHQVPLGSVQVDIEPLDDGAGLTIEATAEAEAKTGVEMEALTAASLAALTVYDMCKSAERGIRITDIRLVNKSGGIHGDYAAD